MKLGRHVKKLTRAKSFFRDKKRSCCLTFFKAGMSFGSKRGCSKMSAAYWVFPIWNSLMEELQGMAAPSNSNLGFHAKFEGRTSAKGSVSLLLTEEALPLP